MLGNMYDIVRNSLDKVNEAKSDSSSASTDPTPTAVDHEKDFMDRYKNTTGQDLYPQYRDVGMGNGTTRRALAYAVTDPNGNQLNYVPLIHGNDYPFTDSSILAQIPSVSHVQQGQFISGSEAGAPVQGPPNMAGLMSAVNGGAQAGAVGASPSVNSAAQPTSQSSYDLSNVTQTQDGTYADANGNPLSGVDPTLMSSMFGSQSTTPTTIPPVDNGTVDNAPLNSDGKNATDDSNFGVTDDVAGARANFMSRLGIDPNDPNLPRDKDGNIDYEKLIIAAMNTPSGADAVRKTAMDEYAKAAGQSRQIVQPKVGGPGMWATLALAALAGRQGGSLIGGAIRGVGEATAQRQAQSDADFNAAQAMAQAKLKEGLAQAEALDADKKAKIATYGLLNKTETDRLLKEQTNLIKKQRADALDEQIRGKATSDSYKRIITAGNPQARYDEAKRQGYSDEEALAFKSKSSQELWKDAQTSLDKEREKNIAELLPYKQFTETAKQAKLWSDANLADQRNINAQLDATLKDKVIKGWDEKRKADLASENARTAELGAQTNALKAKLQSGGITPTEYAKQIGALGKQAGAAQSAVDKNISLVNDLTAQKSEVDQQLADAKQSIALGKKISRDANGKQIIGDDFSGDEDKKFAEKQVFTLSQNSNKINTALGQAQAAWQGAKASLNSVQKAASDFADYQKKVGIKGQGTSPTPTQTDLDYVKAHPETKAAFIKHFGYDPSK